MSDDTVTWLRGCVADTEAKATAAAADTSAKWRHPGGSGSIVDGYGDDLDPHDTGIVVYDEGRPTEAEAAHIARNDPAQVLATCAAHRAIIDLHVSTDGQSGPGRWCAQCANDDGTDELWFADYPCDTIRALASIYFDRPGWREEWAL